MSKCMTIADETVDQKGTCTEITPKDIVEFILEEALLSAFITSDKGCSRIGDFNIREDFRQPYDQLPHLKDFEQVDNSQNQSAESQESNLDSGENVDRPGRGSLEAIIDSYVKIEEAYKHSPGECTVISPEVLANKELQIKDGQIHLGKSKSKGALLEEEANGAANDVVTNEKIEIEYFNEGKLNKIYVPLNPVSSLHVGWVPASTRKEQEDGVEGREGEAVGGEDPERPFEPFATEELRQSTLQVWGNGSSSLVGNWEGDVLAQREEAVRLMEELSSVQVFPDGPADPNRPRACSFSEEDIKKMIKEIEDISFARCHAISEDLKSVSDSDGQGDVAGSESKSKEDIGKLDKFQSEPGEGSSTTYDYFRGDDEVPEEIDLSFAGAEFSFRAVNLSLKEDVSAEHSAGTVIKGRHSLQSVALGRDHEEPLNLGERVFTSYTVIPKVSGTESVQNSTENEIGCSKASTEIINGEGSRSPLRGSRSHWSAEGISMHLGGSREEGLDASFGADLPSRRMQGRGSAFSCSTFTNDLRNELYLLGNSKDSSHRRDAWEEFSPDTMSLSGNVGSLCGNKLDDVGTKSLDVASQLDVRTYREREFFGANGSRGMNVTPEIDSELNVQMNQGTIIMGRVDAPSAEKTPNEDSLPESKDLGLFSTDNDLLLTQVEEVRESQEPDNLFQGPSVSQFVPEKHFDFIKEYIDEKLREAFIEEEGNVRDAGSELEVAEEKQVAGDDVDVPVARDEACNLGGNDAEGKKSPSCEETSQSPPSVSGSEVTVESRDEADLPEDSEVFGTSTQKFKLHSQKMYWGPNSDPADQLPKKFSLTKSEEAFIDSIESVIQIIEPSEHVTEDFGKISFSLLSDIPKGKSLSSDREVTAKSSDSSETANLTKRVHSGMTTIGPIKNIDYDPKDLTAPEIEFGKMTRITSSRQLTKDMGLFGSEVTTIKIVEEDYSDDDESLNADDGRVERNSLINRDIASLTKVQKVREVMSYQPKPEEDFEDEEVLSRPRLDLKDVESMIDERYKVPDVTIPLLSFEIGETNLAAEKDLIDSIGLVISGLTNSPYFPEDPEEADAENKENESDDSCKSTQPSDVSVNVERSSTSAKEEDEISRVTLEKERSVREFAKESEPELSATKSTKDTRSEGGESNQKCHTLGTVFKKASTKFIRLDGDISVRNSRSLPREASRTSATDSIRTLMDDCQSSASNMLKKSRSLLKNTHSMFKSISQSRMGSESQSSKYDGKKLSPSESNVSTVERKFSGFFKKEDFAKAKNIIKDKVEKAFKSCESKNSSANEPEARDESDLRVAVRNTGDLQVERLENFKKFFPKSPLVYKSQFVKSQMDVQNSIVKSESVAEEAGFQKNAEESTNPFLEESVSDDKEGTEVQPTISECQERRATEKGVSFDENLQWIAGKENFGSSEAEEQPDFIVMETVSGLPAADLESPSSEKENRDVGNRGIAETETSGKDLKKTEESNSMQILSAAGLDVAPRVPENDEEKVGAKAPSERKIKTKKKKFTARLRNFWCSTFGRMKTPPAKGEIP